MIDINKYNNQNIFSKILEGSLPCKKVFENKFVLAFYDINPQAPIHILVIPKKKYCSFTDFMKENDDESILQVMKAIQKIAEKLDLKSGYRIICNVGNDGGQEVPHVHFHLLSGKNLGKIIS